MFKSYVGKRTEAVSSDAEKDLVTRRDIGKKDGRKKEAPVASNPDNWTISGIPGSSTERPTKMDRWAG